MNNVNHSYFIGEPTGVTPISSSSSNSPSGAAAKTSCLLDSMMSFKALISLSLAPSEARCHHCFHVVWAVVELVVKLLCYETEDLVASCHAYKW